MRWVRLKNPLLAYAARMKKVLSVVVSVVVLFEGVAAAQQGPSSERPFVFARELWVMPGTETEPAVPDASFFDSKPTTADVISVAEGHTNAGDGYAQRLRGWIEAPQTGSYRFFLASDDHAELWLSTDEDPANIRHIASVEGNTQPLGFEPISPQMSRAITLIKGSRYYLEARHKEGSMDDHLSVGWRVPRSGVSEPYLIGTTPTPAFTFERWTGVNGGDPAGLTVFDGKPDSSVKRFTMTSPQEFGQFVATRLSGTLVVPKTGEYVFLLSADDAAVLYVSTTGTPDAIERVCGLESWVNPGTWKGRSAPMTLKQGQTIYVEARHHQGTGPGHVHIGWQGPKGFKQLPIRSNSPPSEA